MMSEANGSAPAGNPAPGAGEGAGGAAQDWTSGFDEGTRGLVQTKGWKSPADVLGSYQNLEKLLGADKAGRALVPPKDDATPEEWAQFYGKLGRPEKSDGYKLPVPQGDNGEFAKQAAAWMHDAGLTPRQAEALATKWNEHFGSAQQALSAEFEQKAAVDLQDLKREWGPNFEANSELARRAVREAGLTQEEGQAIERALGLGKAAKVFAFLGKQFAEAPMKGGEGDVSGRFGASPEAAKARIASLKADREWSAKYINGDAGARAEFERLHRIAFPETA